MSFLKNARVAAIGRVFMGALFVGTIWMAGVGCEVEDHDRGHDHDRHVEEIHVDHDHDHDHDRDWH